MTKEIFVVGDLNVLATFLDKIAGKIYKQFLFRLYEEKYILKVFIFKKCH